MVSESITRDPSPWYSGQKGERERTALADGEANGYPCRKECTPPPPQCRRRQSTTRRQRLPKGPAAMLNFWGPALRSGSLSRRELLLRVGGLSLTGLSLPLLLNRPAAAADGAKPAGSFGKAKNCIILYLSGAPSQLDTFDPKPDAPDDIRGEFGTIATAVPGVRFSELLPLSAQHMDRIGPRPHHDPRPQRPWPRLLLDVHGLSLWRVGQRRELHEPGRHAAHGVLRGQARPRQGADVPVRHRAAPHGRGRRPPGRPVRRLAGGQVRPAAHRRQPQRRRLPPGASAAGANEPADVLKRRMGLRRPARGPDAGPRTTPP